MKKHIIPMKVKKNLHRKKRSFPLANVYFISLLTLIIFLIFQNHRNQDCNIVASAKPKHLMSYKVINFLYKQRIKNRLSDINHSIVAIFELSKENYVILAKIYINNKYAKEFNIIANKTLEETIKTQTEIFLSENNFTDSEIQVKCKNSIPENFFLWP